MLDLLQILWLLHVEDGLDLDRVCFDSSRGYEVAEHLASRDAEKALLWVQLDLVSIEVVEGLLKVVDGCGTVPGFHDDIVNVNFDVLAYLLIEASLHASLVRGASVLQAEGHHVVAEDTTRCDERGLLLVFDFQFNLVVA